MAEILKGDEVARTAAIKGHLKTVAEQLEDELGLDSVIIVTTWRNARDSDESRRTNAGAGNMFAQAESLRQWLNNWDDGGFDLSLDEDD